MARTRPASTASTGGATPSSGTAFSKAVSKAYDGDIQMIKSSSIRVPSQAANAQKRRPIPLQGSLAGQPEDDWARANFKLD